MGDFSPVYQQDNCPILEQCCLPKDKQNDNGQQQERICSAGFQGPMPKDVPIGSGEVYSCYDAATGHQRGCDCPACVATRAAVCRELGGKCVAHSEGNAWLDLRRNSASSEAKEIKDRLKSSCLMKENLKWEMTDETLNAVEKRFRQYPLGFLGQSVVHYGAANDLDIPKEISHGWKEKDVADVSALVNSPMKTCDEQRELETAESIYHSNRFHPIGKCPDPTDKLPPHIDPEETTFGVKKQEFEDGIKAANLVNPKIDRITVEESDKCFKPQYKITHQDYYPGEQICRKYDGVFDRNGKFGIVTPNDPRGRVVKRLLTGWKTYCPDPTDLNQAYVDHVDFRSPKLGASLDKYRIGRTWGKEVIFGKKSYVELSTPANEVIFNRCKDERAQDAITFYNNFVNWIFLMRKKFRGDMTREAAIRLEGFYAEFMEVDDLADGVVSWDTFHEILCLYRLPIIKEKEDFQESLAYFQIYFPPPCDRVDFHKLIEFIKGFAEPLFPFDTTCLSPYYIPHTNGDIHHRTTYDDLAANMCEELSDCEKFRVSHSFGRQRAQIPSDAWSLISPSVYTTKGISNRDAWTSVGNSQMKRLLCLAKVQISHEEFDKVWKEAQKLDLAGNERVSFQTFREALHIFREVRNNEEGYHEEIDITDSTCMPFCNPGEGPIRTMRKKPDPCYGPY